MKLTRITGKNFMGHEDFDLIIPETGIILITGPNGAGKSSFIEAPAVAIHGKTLRGTPPWRDKKAFVEVEADGHTVRRTRKGARNVVEITGVGDHDTATKANDWLASAFGPFDVWRKTHVFSSQDVAHFTLSTDAERKRLLEGLLDLGHFDSAHAKCKADLKAALLTEATEERKASMLEQRVEQLIAERKRLKAQQVEVDAEVASSVDLGELEARELILVSDLSNTKASIERVRTNVSTRNAQKDVLNRKLQRLSISECPTCEQPIGDELRQTVQVEIKKVDTEAQDYAAAAKADYEAAREHEQTITNELDQVRRQIATERANAAASTRALRLKEQIDRQFGSVSAEVREALASLEAAQDALEAAQIEALTLRACERVLGLKGVRAHVLGRTLSGVEAVANSWLDRIAGHGMTLSLKPYSEKKTGGSKDAILLEVEGAGGGYGYKASSGGERRRIDVSILLALAEVAGAAHGIEGGSLFFDEVFDSLDAEGVDAVIEAVRELAEDRAVIIISHSEDFVSRLSPTRHVHLG